MRRIATDGIEETMRKAPKDLNAPLFTDDAPVKNPIFMTIVDVQVLEGIKTLVANWHGVRVTMPEPLFTVHVWSD